MKFSTKWGTSGFSKALTWEYARGSCIDAIFEDTVDSQPPTIARSISGAHIR